jgi:hypothetical protein
MPDDKIAAMIVAEWRFAMIEKSARHRLQY